MANKSDGDTIRVKHMFDATRESLDFIKGKTRKDLDSNRILTLALLKQLELIGEAASRVTVEFKEAHPAIPWQVIVATRNRLIHGYFDIDLDVVWKTVDQDLRKLGKQLGSIIKHHK